MLRRAVLAVVAAGLVGVSSAGAVSSASPWIVTGDPTWSPDGTHIALAYSRGAAYRIAEAPALGGGATRTVYSAENNGCCDPILWAAAGRILFVTNDTLTSLPTNGRPTTLFASTPWFILSPNREVVAFDDGCLCGHSPDAIGLVGASGGKLTVIAKPKNATDTIDGFSPDGTALVFTRSHFNAATGTSHPYLLVQRLTGGAPVLLSRSALIGWSRLPRGAAEPQWSPDGKWIAFHKSGLLEIVSTTGGAVRSLAPLSTFGAFSWSPTSARLAYVAELGKAPAYGSDTRLATVDLQGHRKPLWNSPSLHYLSEIGLDRPQWSPDGSKLVFLARSGPRYPPIHIWIVGANGHGLKRIA